MWPSDSARTKDWVSEALTDADLEGQFDILHQYNNDELDGTSGHGHTGGDNDGKQLDLTVAVTGVLPVANGGTGQATLAAFLGAVYPIGCIYTTVSSTNPNTTFGFGTWVAVGSGQVLVGVNSSDSDFNAAEVTGGAKTVAHTHPGSTDGVTFGNAPSGVTGAITASTLDTKHYHTFTTDSSSPSVVQPFYCVYFYKRTA